MSESEHDDTQQEEEPEIDMTGWITKEIIQSGLGGFDKTCDNRGYAYLSLNLAEKELEVLRPDIESFIHLSRVDLSKNNLKEISALAALPNLISINASENAIETVEILENKGTLQNLRTLDLSKNKLTRLPKVCLRRLTRLNVKENEISSVEGFVDCYNLSIIEFRTNKLTNLKGFENIPNLKGLFVAENEITSFSDVQNLPKLEIFHLRKNAIEKLPEVWPELPSLKKYNLRENQIADLAEIKKFEQLEDTHWINLAGNPVSDEAGDGFKKEVLIMLPYMEVVNKDAVTEEDRKEAEEEKDERRKEEEEKRRIAEEEAAEAEKNGEEGEAGED